jgi:hypothetical protein
MNAQTKAALQGPPGVSMILAGRIDSACAPQKRTSAAYRSDLYTKVPDSCSRMLKLCVAVDTNMKPYSHPFHHCTSVQIPDHTQGTACPSILFPVRLQPRPPAGCTASPLEQQPGKSKCNRQTRSSHGQQANPITCTITGRSRTRSNL